MILKSKSYNFLENAKGLMKIRKSSENSEWSKQKAMILDLHHVKLQQEIKGIPVYGSEVIYHYNEKESFLNGRYHATPELDSYKPSLHKMCSDIAIEDVGELQN